MRLIYSIALLSGLQQSDSVYRYILFQITFPTVHYKILSVVPHANTVGPLWLFYCYRPNSGHGQQLFLMYRTR